MPFKSSQNRVIIPVVEMTPMIDIVFLLIIFFMVAAQFAQQARVEVALPIGAGEQDTDIQASKLVINIRANGEIVLDESIGEIDLKTLNTQLQTFEDEGASWEDITIRADRDSSTEVLNDILGLLSEHGMKATNIATEVP